MIRKTAIVVALTVLGAASLATAAENTVVYINGQNPANITRVQVKPQTQAPYALTGSEQTTTRELRTENIWVGSRFAGARVVEK